MRLDNTTRCLQVKRNCLATNVKLLYMSNCFLKLNETHDLLVIVNNCSVKFDLCCSVYLKIKNLKLETRRCLCISNAKVGGTVKIGRGRRDGRVRDGGR